MIFKESDSGNYRVWLSQDEVGLLLETPGDQIHRLAYEVGVRCGLRSVEITRVAPEDLSDTAAGDMLRVESAKTDNDEVRQTPVPAQLATRIRTISQHRDEPEEEPLIDASTRTLRRWITRTTDAIAAKTGDDMWSEVTMHDLRRTWASSLNSADVDAMVVCDWGGWDDIDTFLDHYRATAQPEAQLRQREKVDWL